APPGIFPYRKASRALCVGASVSVTGLRGKICQPQSGFFSVAPRPSVVSNFVTLAPRIHVGTLWGAPRSCSLTWRSDAVLVACCVWSPLSMPGMSTIQAINLTLAMYAGVQELASGLLLL